MSPSTEVWLVAGVWSGMQSHDSVGLPGGCVYSHSQHLVQLARAANKRRCWLALPSPACRLRPTRCSTRQSRGGRTCRSLRTEPLAGWLAAKGPDAAGPPSICRLACRVPRLSRPDQLNLHGAPLAAASCPPAPGRAGLDTRCTVLALFLYCVLRAQRRASYVSLFVQQPAALLPPLGAAF